MDDDPDLNQEDALFSEANKWFFRLHAEDVAPDARLAFKQWLAEAPSHAKAWNEVCALMAALRSPAQASFDAQQVERIAATPRGARARGRLLHWIAGGLASAFGFAAVLHGPVLIDRWQADYMTMPGERRTARLSDGTRIELNTDTALKVDISSDARRVKIIRGEAFFEVRPDARPFIAQAGDGETRDIGTAFSVATDDDHSTVTVESGIVDVSQGPASGRPIRLTGGQSVDYRPGGISPIRRSDIESDLAWRRGQLVFRQQKLEDVVAKLNRYRAGRIFIINPWISSELVSGSFNINQPASAIEALEGVLGIKALSITSYVVLLH